jgi:hypothetical protein
MFAQSELMVIIHRVLFAGVVTEEWPSWLDWLPSGLHTWDAWVAIGTLGLAFATIGLALSTRRLAARTQQDVEVATRSALAAERGLAIGVRPLLADVPIGTFLQGRQMGQHEYQEDVADIDVDVYVDEAQVEIKVPLRNVGAGLALLAGPQLDIDVERLSWRAVAQQTAVPSGDLTRLDFYGTWPDVETAGAQGVRLEENAFEFSVQVSYTDLNGEQETVTRAVLRHRLTEEDDDWYIERIEHQWTAGKGPFAVLSGRAHGVAIEPAVE